MLGILNLGSFLHTDNFTHKGPFATKFGIHDAQSLRWLRLNFSSRASNFFYFRFYQTTSRIPIETMVKRTRFQKFLS